LPQIIPVAIEIISNNCFNLDTYIPNYTDIINIYILEPISYDKYFFQYMDTTDVTIKNNLMHDVMDKGMNNIADKLNKSYIKKYIELFPKNNVIFSNGTKIDSGTAQNKYYINIYKAELEKRLQLLSI
jgi:hypothetical protein